MVQDITAFMLTPRAQAFAWDEGYFYPGPALKDVPLSSAPADSQETIKEFGRPEYEKILAGTPQEVPLDADKMVLAFRMWDERIGGRKTK